MVSIAARGALYGGAPDSNVALNASKRCWRVIGHLGKAFIGHAYDAEEAVRVASDVSIGLIARGDHREGLPWRFPGVRYALRNAESEGVRRL
jgi:hypothetical protein